MSIPLRRFLFITLSLFLLTSGTRAFRLNLESVSKPTIIPTPFVSPNLGPSASDIRQQRGPSDQQVYRNNYGAVTRDSNGQRTYYTEAQIEAQKKDYLASHSPSPSFASPAASTSGPEATWVYGALETGIGLSGIAVGQNGPNTEIYSAGGFNTFWMALRYNSTTAGYDEIFTSPYFSSTISSIKVDDVTGDPNKEIIVALQNGEIYLYDLASKTLIKKLTTAANGLSAMGIADVDGDGANELVVCTANHLYVYSGDGALKWDLAGVGGTDLVIAQMDTDPALEIAVTDGHVIDCGTHQVQWTWQHGFGIKLAAADIDGDGIAELIDLEQWYFAFAYDVDQQVEKWSLPTPLDNSSLLVTDVDGDGKPEIVIGQRQIGKILAFDPVTLQQKWTLTSPESGEAGLVAADVDGDGVKELVWGAGYWDTGPDHLYVGNWGANTIKWQNVDLDGSFLGPVFGDLDGDGHDEMVVVSQFSDSTYSSGRILVFDADTLQLRAISGPTMRGNVAYGTNDLKLKDLNGDGKMEIVLAAAYIYSGLTEIYSFDSSNKFTLQWSNTVLPANAQFLAVDAADIDNDGQLEIVTGATDGYLRAYSYATGALKWQSSYLFGQVTALGISDLNNDGSKEVVGMTSSGIYIYNGVTKAQESVVQGSFTSMQVQDINSAPTIIVGDSAGELKMYDYVSGSYTQTYSHAFTANPIQAFTLDSQNNVWVGDRARIFPAASSAFGTLTEFGLDGSVLASYSGYGQPFGQHVAFRPDSQMFFTTSVYAIEGFPLPGSGLCNFSLGSSIQSFGAVGGSGSLTVNAGDTCDWDTQSNAAWITVKSITGLGNGSVQYTVASNTGPARSGTLTVAGLTFMVSQAANTFAGFLDGAGCGTISGWAWDSSNISGSIAVDIYDGNTLIATTMAGMYREDLLNVLGSPNHGFSFPTPAALKDGAPHTITVMVSGTNIPVSSTARTLRCGESSVNLMGFHDGVGCNTICGWAMDANDPGNIVNVDVYDGTTLIGTIAATQYRQDLANVFGQPFHGFNFPVPASLRDGQPHTITVKFGGTSTALGNSPKTLTCSGSGTKNLQGSQDPANCNTISGFAWDANDNLSTYNVAIYADGNFLITIPAQQSSPGIGSGFHGYVYNVPASLKDGHAHSILVKFSGTITSVSNSPRTLTCP